MNRYDIRRELLGVLIAAVGTLAVGIVSVHSQPATGGVQKTSEPASKSASSEEKPAIAPSAVDAQRDASDIRPLNSDILPALLKQRGFTPSDTFKALVIEIIKNDSGGYTYYPMDFFGTSEDRDDWWPASSVKLFAAIATLEKTRALGFSPKAELTFEYEDETIVQSLEEVLRRAITDSKNPEFDRLVELVGADRLNDHFLTTRNGLGRTVMRRAYSGRLKHPVTHKSLNIRSPKILLTEGPKHQVLAEQTAKGDYPCYNNGNCTTLKELTEALRRVMMQESIPKAERYKLGDVELTLLRSALKGKWAKGGVNDALRVAFKGRPFEIFHKGGYADLWFMDNVFFRVNDTGEQWIVAMVNRPGRESLNEAALHVTALMASGAITEARRNAYEEASIGVADRPETAIEVLPREAWGADPPKRAYVRHEISKLTVHHQGVVFAKSERAPARLRTMQQFHQSTEKGFADIAYHFVIDPDGNIYQGRPVWAAGETETDYDPKGHLLICMMGDFDKQQPGPAQLDALIRLLAWAAQQFHLGADAIEGHRDHAHTECPGKNLEALITDGTVARRVESLTAQTRLRLSLLGVDEAAKQIRAITRRRPI